MKNRRAPILVFSALCAAFAVLGPGDPALAQVPDPTYEEQVLELVNQQRWTNGQLAPLKGVSTLDQAGETHSQNMATRDFFSHCDLDTGTNYAQRMTAAGYAGFSWAAETIAAGSSSPAGVMGTWMGSPLHAGIILSELFREIGVGYAYQASDLANVRYDGPLSDCIQDSILGFAPRHYWTADFGTRNSVYPVVIDREAHSTDTALVSLYLYGVEWATEMRLRNENGLWTAWMPFQTSYGWSLSTAGGLKTVNVEIRNGGTVRAASDTIWLEGGISDLVLMDGFESGDFGAWSNVAP